MKKLYKFKYDDSFYIINENYLENKKDKYRSYLIGRNNLLKDMIKGKEYDDKSEIILELTAIKIDNERYEEIL